MLNVTKVDTWVATLDDRVGSLAGKLEGLAQVGVNLEFLIARRSPDRPGHGVVFLTPVTGNTQEIAAARLGFHRSVSHQAIRIEGADEQGVAYLITRAVASIGVNIRGVSAARMGGRFVMYLAFDSAQDAEKATARLNQAL